MPKLYIIPALGDTVFTKDVKLEPNNTAYQSSADYLEEVNQMAAQKKKPVHEISDGYIRSVKLTVHKVNEKSEKETPAERKARKLAEKQQHIEQLKAEAEKRSIEQWRNSRQYSYYDVVAIAAGAILIAGDKTEDFEAVIEKAKQSIINYHEYQTRKKTKAG